MEGGTVSTRMRVGTRLFACASDMKSWGSFALMRGDEYCPIMSANQGDTRTVFVGFRPLFWLKCSSHANRGP